MKLFLVCLIFFFAHACEVSDFIESEPLSDLIFNNKNWDRLSEYPRGSYVSLKNPALIHVIDKMINNDEFKIYIVSHNETDDNIHINENQIVKVKPFFITALEVAKNLLLARFRFFINEKNKASIYASSFYIQNCGVEIHAMLLATLEDFLKEKNVSSVKNLTERFETRSFFADKGYDGLNKKKLE